MTDEPNNPIISQAGNKEAIELWRTVTLQSVRNDEYDFSARQMAILLTLYSDNNQFNTVTSLANHLKVAKPPITRALDKLSKYGLVHRVANPTDRRIIHIQTTDKGYDYLAKFSENIMAKLILL